MGWSEVLHGSQRLSPPWLRQSLNRCARARSIPCHRFRLLQRDCFRLLRLGGKPMMWLAAEATQVSSAQRVKT
jgi:hypothetical protein